LTYSRKQIAHTRPLQINEVVSAMQKLLGRLVREDVDFRMNLAEGLPLVEADPSQIEQVVMNLVVNARDAMPEGGSLVLATGYLELDDGYIATHPGSRIGPHVTLSVTDTGTGMDAGVIARIFEPFFTTKEVGKGTGLGLASVYGIVNQSGGHVVVQSELGRGSTFQVLLPAIQRVDARHSQPIETLPAPSDRRQTVLLAEDDESVRHFTRRVLEAAGYRVLEAKDGVEALALAESLTEPIDLLLTDVVMPHMRGTELAERVNKIRPGVKVLLTSGYLDDGVPFDGGAGRLQIILKPYRADQLTDTIARVLNRTSED
jgi:CheY-like chemotaxis protein